MGASEIRQVYNVHLNTNWALEIQFFIPYNQRRREMFSLPEFSHPFLKNDLEKSIWVKYLPMG